MKRATRPRPSLRAAARRTWSLLFAGVAAVAADSASAHDGREVSVVTLNLWHDAGDWPRRAALIVRTLRTLRPDVIALQEVLQDRGLPNQAKTIADALGFRYVFASVDAADKPRRYGNAILTRHRILAQGWKALAPLDDYRVALHLRIAVDGEPVEVYATHLHWTPEGGAIRRAQVEDLEAYIAVASAPDAPTVVAGDFNAPANAPEFAPLLARLRDAYDVLHACAAQDDAGHSTLNLAFYAPLRIDHVLYDPRAWTPLSATRLFDRPAADGTWASDHYGVRAVLRRRP